MRFILFDDKHFSDLKPFTFTRAVADIRIGILTIREKWNRYLNTECSVLTRKYLSDLYPEKGSGPVIYINGALLPDKFLADKIKALTSGEVLTSANRIVAIAGEKAYDIDFFLQGAIIQGSEDINNAVFLSYGWQIFNLNDQELRKDFSLITEGRKSAAISDTNRISGRENIFLEDGAKMEHCIVNASTGPVYIAADAEVMEGCLIRGPFALGEHGVLKLGTKIYGATTIGPGAKVGGEVSNSVLFGNSNKAHDGFLGNSVIGEWCNLGADTNNSNLKNNYGEVSVWNYTSGDYIKTGLQFCGLFMGDHSKCGINTMFNTGTTVGVFANIFGAGFPDKYIPSFTWGGTGESEVFLIDKALELAGRVMERRGRKISEADKEVISHLYMEQLKPLSGIDD